ncbi:MULTISPECIES: NAD(P)-dependent oxidoreductase [unclassified Janibacter]|uniref:NAD(P)-dependent oxidoreductase n=1 Tax=unclassified Janibacter TaxID=2649294 RepID=UPI003D01E88B
MSTSPRHPLFLDLTGRRVLVVGGGEVATRRALRAADDGALVHVVAKEATASLREAAAAGRVTLDVRPFALEDLTSPRRAWLVHSATGDEHVDGLVAARAADEAIWCVRADSAERSAAWSASVATVDAQDPGEGIVVAVTGGGDPRRGMAVRDAVAGALAAGTLPLRRQRPGGNPWGGRVAVIEGAAGPADLLTVRARALLAVADVVVADDPSTAEVLTEVGDDVEVIAVGRAAVAGGVTSHGGTSDGLSQDAINALLVRAAREGRFVVRLADVPPLAPGRAEEAAHCAGHGLAVEIVPGVVAPGRPVGFPVGVVAPAEGRVDGAA